MVQQERFRFGLHKTKLTLVELGGLLVEEARIMNSHLAVANDLARAAVSYSTLCCRFSTDCVCSLVLRSVGIRWWRKRRWCCPLRMRRRRRRRRRGRISSVGVERLFSLGPLGSFGGVPALLLWLCPCFLFFFFCFI